MKSKIVFLLVIFSLTGCVGSDSGSGGAVMHQIAREYLFLELSMGLHDAGHVDAYFGPGDIQDEVNGTRLAVDEIAERVRTLQQRIDDLPDTTDAMEQMRIDGLTGRLLALETRLAMLMGEHFSFDEESRRLFGAAAPDHDAAHFEAILEQIDALVGGEGPLSGRVAAFRDQFVVPPGKLGAVFNAAIAECRRRTLLHIALPANESFIYTRIRQRQALVWLQLVQGERPKPDPDQYRSAHTDQPGGRPRLPRGIPRAPHV